MPNSVLINHHWATHKHTQVFVLKNWLHCFTVGLEHHDYANTKNTQAILKKEINKIKAYCDLGLYELAPMQTHLFL